ncbi:NAD(P)/FAD-dependent oxidoreductase [Pseudohongiella sp. SYSU M77423]|uniref:NAD(P)/FAD-dependent oxidoreductase n=1 Tax=Pseudohongiella sp. SYSU M77423 TaxID=3042312 RepID=UPI00247FEE27|nr:NAD(P)/FAD-dependent oxidoreductase [Pseudohongiella sp. SYSU M77423]MDH7943137.1 NAD(P)/FAD-dependent oxidoreductase [Pseudohongiella sp. SYSU M77423]
MNFEVDICIVGAGVCGLAIARQLSQSLPSSSVALIEQAESVGQGISSRNSEVIHAGIYYAPDSLKARLCVAGRHLLYEYCRQYQVPVRQIGKLIVAQSGEEDTLNRIADNARASGVENLQSLNASRIASLAPAVRADAGLWSPSTGIIDSHEYMQSLLKQAQANGVMLALATRLNEVRPEDSGKRLELEMTSNWRRNGAETSRVACRLLINCAGLGALDIAERLHQAGVATNQALPKIKWVKGNYFAYQGRTPFSHLIYPVPDPTGNGLGIHATLDMAGNCRFGPDVEQLAHDMNSEDVLDLSVNASRRDMFARQIRRYFPALDESRLVPDYAGIRTRVTGDGFQDFQIVEQQLEGCAAIHLLGIESPGLTASLALANHLAERISQQQLLG